MLSQNANKITIPLGGEYKSNVLLISNQTLVNCYFNQPQTDTFTQSTLFGTAGLKQLATTGITDQVNRGCHEKQGKPYFVNGTRLYRLDKSIDAEGGDLYTPVELGTITGSDRCSFADNGKQLMIVADGKGWIVDEDSDPVFQPITDESFTSRGTPQQVVFIDGFFIVTTDTKLFILSELNDGLSYNALQFVSAEVDPDNIVAPIVNRNRLFIGGTQTREVCENLGTGGVPFKRVNGFVVAKGMASPFGAVNVGSTFMWIGSGINESPAIWILNGTDAKKVSTTAIDSELQKFSSDELSQAFTWSYAQNGAFFVGFNFPTVTYVYDLMTGKWHTRKSYILKSDGKVNFNRCRLNSITTAYGKVLCGDSVDGRIGELDLDTYSEYEQPLLREMTTATVYNKGSSFTVPRLEITSESGLLSEVENPQVRLSTSKDGKKWSMSRTRRLGKEGETQARQIWHGLGRFPKFAFFKLSFSDKAKFSLIDMVVEVISGR